MEKVTNADKRNSRGIKRCYNPNTAEYIGTFSAQSDGEKKE
jgi:hypothetical protein